MFGAIFDIVEGTAKVATGTVQATVGVVTDPLFDSDNMEDGMDRIEDGAEDIFGKGDNK